MMQAFGKGDTIAALKSSCVDEAGGDALGGGRHQCDARPPVHLPQHRCLEPVLAEPSSGVNGCRTHLVSLPFGAPVPTGVLLVASLSCIVGLINGDNFMDGLNGLASVEGSDGAGLESTR